MIFSRLLLIGVLSALKTFAMFLGKPFEWVLLFPACTFILPTPVMPIFKSFSLQLFFRISGNLWMTNPWKNNLSRPLFPIISEAPVLRCSVVRSGGGVTVVTSHPHTIRWLNKSFLCRAFSNLILSLSAFIKMYDVPVSYIVWTSIFQFKWG